MSESEPQFDTAAACLFATIVGFMLPFYLAGAAGNPDLAHSAIMELISAYDTATAAELDLAGRLIGFSAASMDNLRLSMRDGLSDAKVLQYRDNAVALGRSAKQCRKVLEALQTKRERRREQLAMAHPMPSPKPAPVVPPRQPTPPRQAPPVPPKASAQPASAVEGDPAFTIDIGGMKRNVHAMLADLQARANDLETEAPDASIARMGLERSRASHSNHSG